ncbi:MAG: tetratricopeptide repeat protein, partial [Candidatus Hermodarchaeota archaeon]
KYPEDDDLRNYKAFWLQYLNRKEESIKIIKDLIERAPNNATYHDSYGEILMFFKDYENAISEFLKVINISSGDWYLYQTNIKVGICYREIEDYENAIEYLQKGKELIDKSSSDLEERAKWITIANLFLAEIEHLKEEF